MPFRNLVVNGDFESGVLAPWSSLNASVDSTTSHTGLFSARLQGGNVTAYLSQFVPATPGAACELLVSLSDTGALPSPFVSVSVGYYDAEFRFLGHGLIHSFYSNRLPDCPDSTWLAARPIAVSAAPVHAAQAQLFIGKLPAAGSPDLFVDDVQLVQSPGAAQQGYGSLYGFAGPLDIGPLVFDKAGPALNAVADLSANSITVFSGGNYEISASVTLQNFNSGNDSAGFEITRNGAPLIPSRFYSVFNEGGVFFCTVGTSFHLFLEAGDELAVKVIMTAGRPEKENATFSVQLL